MTEPPSAAAWKQLGARDGFEVLFVRRERDGYVLDGHAVAVEEDEVWGVRYVVSVDPSWRTRSAHVIGRSASGSFETRLEADGVGRWQVDGRPVSALDGCLEVDLEASACTNALPVRRLALDVGASADAPAAYVRATDLRIERLEQRYTRLADDGDRLRFDYEAPAFGFREVLVFDRFGLAVDYPGIAVRVA